MASPKKADVLAELAMFNVEPPDGSTVADLVRLLRRVKALRSGSVVEPPKARRTPASPAPTHTFTPAAQVASTSLIETRIPGPGSDHHRRPHDPMAGW